VDILLHQTDDHLSLLGDGKSILRVVEPPVIGVQVDLSVFGLFVTVGEGGVRATRSVALPVSLDGELVPIAGENLADVDSVVVGAPVLVGHPPVAIVLENVVKVLLETLAVIPSLFFVSELSSPFTLASSPRVSDSDELKLVRWVVSDLEHTVGVIEKNTLVSVALLLLTTVVLDRVSATDQVALLVILLQVFPELSRLNRGFVLRRSQIVLLGHTTCKVDKTLSHVTAIKNFETAVELGISLLHEGDPKFLRITAVTVKRSLGSLVVRDASVDNHKLPLSILEELEHSVTVFDSIFVDKVVQEFGVGCQAQEGAEQPAVSQLALLYITRNTTVLDQDRFILAVDLAGSLPLDHRVGGSIVGRVQRVHVQGSIVGAELWVSPLLVCLTVYFLDFSDHGLNLFFGRLFSFAEVVFLFLVEAFSVDLVLALAIVLGVVLFVLDFISNSVFVLVGLGSFNLNALLLLVVVLLLLLNLLLHELLLKLSFFFVH